MKFVTPSNAILRCLSIDGSLRYELPSIAGGSIEGYSMYFRSKPTLVIHHTKGKTFELPHQEIILVCGSHHNHCISIALDDRGEPVNMYININLVPTVHDYGHEWQDLEIDIKLVKGYNNCWQPFFVDVQEFEKSSLNSELRQLALKEIEVMIERIRLKKFPFSLDSKLSQFFCEVFGKKRLT